MEKKKLIVLKNETYNENKYETIELPELNEKEIQLKSQIEKLRENTNSVYNVMEVLREENEEFSYDFDTIIDVVESLYKMTLSDTICKFISNEERSE